MLEPHVHLAYAPRGAGVLCAVFWVTQGANCYGWFTGAQAYEHPAHFFVLENYYSTRETVCYQSIEDDARGGWAAVSTRANTPLRALAGPSPLPEAICHDVERLKDAFVREWLFYRHALDAQPEIETLRARELPVMVVNIRPKKLNKLQTDAPVWTYTSPGADMNVVVFLARRWSLDYAPEC